MKFIKVVFFHQTWIFSILLILTSNPAHGCEERGDPNHTYCVCNQTSCAPLVEQALVDGQINVYTSSRNGKRFEYEQIPLNQNNKVECNGHELNNCLGAKLSAIITVHPDKELQKIEGFGGALTDTAAEGIYSLPEKLQTQILDDYLSENGLKYSMMRVPIGGSDFSSRPYALDDQDGDFELNNFTLASEDVDMKIPLLKKMLKMNKDLKIFGSAWSAPAWMKKNKRLNGKGGLIGEPGGKHYKTWANYLVKFIEEYANEDIHFWGLTTQNEPTDGYMIGFPFNCMAFSPEQIRDFIKLDLGPALEKAGYSPDTFRLFIIDDQRLYLPRWANKILSDKDAAKFVYGVAFHWYMNFLVPPSYLDEVHKHHPEMVLLSTEACNGATIVPTPFFKHVDLGSWSRAENYAKDILEDLNHWTSGWVDWNLVVDEQGGPNWVQNFVDAPIVVNASKSEYYRQPMFYVLSHFTKFLPPGSIRLKHDQQVPNWVDKLLVHVHSVCFRTPTGQNVLIALNHGKDDVRLQVKAGEQGNFDVQLNAKSIATYVWLEKKNK